MITKANLVELISAVASGDYSRDAWKAVAVNHYSDVAMEDARRKLVKWTIDFEDKGILKEEDYRELLTSLAADLQT